MKKALHYLENSVYSARNCKVLMMPDSSPSRVYAPMKKALYHFNNSVYALQGGRPQMPDSSPSRVYAFLKLPLLFLKNSVHTSSPDRVYTPLYRKPFAILKITYIRQAPKMPECSSSRVYTPMKKALHHLEKAYTRQASRCLTPALSCIRSSERSPTPSQKKRILVMRP